MPRHKFHYRVSIKYHLQTLRIFIVQLEIDLSLMAFLKKLCSSFKIYLRSFTCSYTMLSIRYFRLLCVRLRRSHRRWGKAQPSGSSMPLPWNTIRPSGDIHAIFSNVIYFAHTSTFCVVRALELANL